MCNYTDFEVEDLYIEVPKKYADRLINILNAADIRCDISISVPDECCVYPCLNDSLNRKRKKLHLFSFIHKDEYSIIRTKLKREKVYYLLSDIIEYGKRDINVEVELFDTRKVE